MTVESDGAGGPLAQVSASLDVVVGRLAALVEHVTDGYGRLQQHWQDVHPVPVWAAPIPGASGSSDLADRLGPKDGYWWDLRRLTAYGYTSGTVTVTINDPTGEQVAVFGQPGQFTWSGNVLLAPRDRLIVTTSTIAGGAVQVQGQAIEVSTQALPDYLD